MAKKIITACLYSPYFPDHFGGGERHVLDIACHLPAQIRVVLAFPNRENFSGSVQEFRQAYEAFYGASLERITFMPAPIGTSAFFLKKLFWTMRFDYFFAVSDGSLFFSLAKKNIAHLQIPFTNFRPSVLNRLKLLNWQLNTNSIFTKTVIEKSWQKKVASVLEPMVETKLFSLAKKKEKIILHVGRFFTQLHSKRQDVLVENFRELQRRHPEFAGWKLVLVGSVEDSEYLQRIRSASLGLDITILTNCTRAELLDLYARSSIYWHATGFGVDESMHPEKVEHFGITTVEAMAAGAVPIVVAKGGQKEVLGDTLSHLSWETSDQCVEQTSRVLSDPELLKNYQALAREQAKKYAEDRFTREVAQLFSYAK